MTFIIFVGMLNGEKTEKMFSLDTDAPLPAKQEVDKWQPDHASDLFLSPRCLAVWILIHEYVSASSRVTIARSCN